MDILLFSASALLTTLWCQEPGSEKEEKELYKALQNGTSLNATERICLVTPTNVVLSQAGLRADMRLHNQWHRATYILIHHEPLHLEQQEDCVLVQQRSRIKDYCPGKLDPLPGGVVGYEESYRDNAIREIQEEMGIVIHDNDNALRRLFTFSYQDERVRVWGDFYEFTYRGALHDLVLQPEEVDHVDRMSLTELQERIESSPEDFMPDACHAMRLYFQQKQDAKVQRRLLKGYSSSDGENYRLRPKPQAIFFDCDDCLYFDGWKTAQLLTNKIDEWCINHGLQPGQAYELYKQYGTALRGLLAEGYLNENEQAIDGFLQNVHDIPVALGRDNALRDLLLAMDPSIPRYIFTASVRDHALRCLQALGIEDLFVDIIDCKTCHLETKHAPYSFAIAQSVAGVDDPECCLFLDDNLKNIKAARRQGWRSVLVGKIGRDCRQPISSEHAELEVDSIHHISQVLPELF